MKNVMTTDQIQTVCVVIAAEMSGNPNPFNYSWKTSFKLKIVLLFLLKKKKARGTKKDTMMVVRQKGSYLR